jgi:hypothetical protein
MIFWMKYLTFYYYDFICNYNNLEDIIANSDGFRYSECVIFGTEPL